MARHTASVCKLCRREGVKLYLKGTRCDTPKCAIDRRDQPPGMHLRRGKQSEYGVRLREKQKLKFFYGVLERQFRRYFALAAKSPENTGEELLSVLERRLDNVIHRLGFAPNRASARQLVRGGHVTVNDHPTDIPSMLLKPGDTLKVKSREKSLKMSRELMREGAKERIPDFLEVVPGEIPEGRLTRLPSRGDVDPRISEIREQLIIEIATR